MEENVLELKEEIQILEKRIERLEKIETRRKLTTYTKVIIKGLLISAIMFGIWYGYNYLVKEIPNIIEEKIKEINPVDSITGIFKK